MGLKPILFINKIDKKDQRAKDVVDLTYELFMDLNATDEQLDFPILYGIAKKGIAQEELEEESKDISPLFDKIISYVPAYPDYDDEPLQMQVSSLAYDDYIGRLGIGRVYKGKIRSGQIVSICKADGSVATGKISQVFVYQGLKRTPVEEATSGDIVVVSGIDDISIGETISKEKSPAHGDDQNRGNHSLYELSYGHKSPLQKMRQVRDLPSLNSQTGAELKSM